jgi:hypothetical protein
MSNSGSHALALIVLVLVTGFAARAQSIPPLCNPTYRSDGTDNGYTLRYNGERCEGFYESQVSQASLLLVSLLEGRLEFDGSHQTIPVMPARNVREEVFVTAMGIPLRTYYRMDARLRPGSTLAWRLTDVVLRKNLRANWIGLTGRLAARPEPTYVPLRVGDASTGTTYAIVRSNVNLASVHWRHAEVSSGQCQRPNAWAKLRSYVGAGDPVTIAMPSGQGERCIEINAMEQEGDSPLRLSFRVVL